MKNFRPGIRKLDRSNKFTKEVLDKLNFICNRIAEKIGKKAYELLQPPDSSQTITHTEILACIQYFFPERLYLFAHSYGSQGVIRYENGGSVSMSHSELKISPNSCKKILKDICNARISERAAIILAASIEYSIIHIYENSGQNNKKIDARALEEIFASKEDFSELLRKTEIILPGPISCSDPVLYREALHLAFSS